MILWCLNNRSQVLASIILVCLSVSPIIDSCFAIESKTFDGRIDFLHKDLTFCLDLKAQGRLEISGNVEGESYNLKLAIRHLKFGKSDLLTDFYTSGIILKKPDGKVEAIKGKAWTQASLLNLKPWKEFSADYELENGRLTINALSWADFDLKGYIEKSPPAGEAGKTDHKNDNPFFNVQADLFLTIKEMPLKDLAGLLGVNPEEIKLSGVISGKARIKGPWGSLKIEAKLSAHDGTVLQVNFKSASLELEGIWPILRFVHSQINDAGAVAYELKGKFNVEKLSEFNSADHQVTVYSANEAMRFEDWVIKRKSDSGEEMLEAAYPLKNSQALKMRFKNEEEILGWEKTVKF